MIRINQLKANIKNSEKEIKPLIIKKLKLTKENNFDFNIVKKSIDARNKQAIKYVYSVDVIIDNEKSIVASLNDKNIEIVEVKKYTPPKINPSQFKDRPIVVGSGPAGLFATYFMAKSGLKPILIERGEAVEERLETVNKFWEDNILNIESNVQFGEGGAGTFSDGKLNTMINDKFGRNREVLETFVKFGAQEEILYYNKPHIGTDFLCNIVKNMREFILENGGEVRFNTKLTDLIINDNKISGIKILNKGKETTLNCDTLVLATGHSSRDTFEMLYSKGLEMQQKSFAIGLRIEHPQYMIDISQYGSSGNQYLPPADYKLTYKSTEGRNVYSFCMCPGGYVVNSSSEEGCLAVNGMSYSGRDGINANSAIIVSVTPEDFNDSHPLAGIEFQRKLERAAYCIGKGIIPSQLYGDFKSNTLSTAYGKFKPLLKGDSCFANLRELFPETINNSIIEGIDKFGKMIKGFDRDDAILSGVESRTSSPVRIVRDECGQSNVLGIYPCGEGAGYAGGITSAAMDRIKVFEEIAKMVYDK